MTTTTTKTTEAASLYSAGGYDDTQKIKVLVKNPKKPGTASHKRFASYKSGMTVKAALAKGVTRPDLRWDVAHQYIEIK